MQHCLKSLFALKLLMAIIIPSIIGMLTLGCGGRGPAIKRIGTKGVGGEERTGAAVKRITPKIALEGTSLQIKRDKRSCKDYLQKRFQGKDIILPEELEPEKGFKEYTVGVDDVLHIFVLNNPELCMDFIVRRDGHISFPLVGSIKVLGLAIPEIQCILKERLSNYIVNPHVIVNPKEVNSLRIFLVGRLKKPGITWGPVRRNFTLKGGNTLLEALSDIEFYPDADLAACYVTRGDTIIPVNLKSLLKDGNLTQNIVLHAHDTVVVPGPLNEAITLGQVTNPGRYKLNIDATLIDAIAAAGGIIRDTADLCMSYVAKNDVVLSPNFRRLLDYGDMSQNIMIEDGDIIYISNTNDNKVFVLGEVRKPGVVRYTEPINMIEAIARRGGFKFATAKRSHVVVVRGGISDPEIYEVDALKIMGGKTIESFTMQRGDIVYVPRTILASWHLFITQILPAAYSRILINEFLLKD